MGAEVTVACPTRPGQPLSISAVDPNVVGRPQVRRLRPLKHSVSRFGLRSASRQLCRGIPGNSGGHSMTLKVVGAGVGRTGSNSLKIALEQLLAAPCHHMFEIPNPL